MTDRALSKHASNFVENEHGQEKHYYLKALHDDRCNIVSLSQVLIVFLFLVPLLNSSLCTCILDNRTYDNGEVYRERNVLDCALILKISIQEAKYRFCSAILLLGT